VPKGKEVALSTLERDPPMVPAALEVSIFLKALPTAHVDLAASISQRARPTAHVDPGDSPLERGLSTARVALGDLTLVREEREEKQVGLHRGVKAPRKEREDQLLLWRRDTMRRR
jgi:hypothetical protein